MICLPLQQFVALMEAWAGDTPPMDLRLILSWCVNTPWQGICQLRGICWLTDLQNILGAICLCWPLGGGGYLSCQVSLGRREMEKLALQKKTGKKAVLWFFGRMEGKVGLARNRDEHNSGLSFSVCKENDPSFPPSRLFPCSRAGNNTEVNSKI